MAIGFFILLFADGVFRVRPKIPLTLSSARAEQQLKADGADSSLSQCGLFRQWVCVNFKRLLRVIPLAAADTMDAFDFLKYVCFWGVVLVPVPFSRVVTNDHTPAQIMFGSLVGAMEAIIWFYF